jgi:stage IV sporulation protein A
VKVRLVDCVGFTVGDAVGYLEEDVLELLMKKK